MDEPSTSENKAAPYISLLAVQLFFGSLPVIGKVVLAVIPSFALVGLRVGITASLLAVIQAARGRFWLKEPADYKKLAILSIFGVTLNQIFFIGGLSLTKAANTSLLASTIPIFTLIAGYFVGIEEIRLRKIAGIFLALAGVVILIDPRNASFSSQTTLGDIVIVINSLSFGIYVATSKDVVTRNGAFRSMMWVFIFASVICVPLGWNSLSTIDIPAVETNIWLLVAYIAVGATTIPYLLNAWALARVSPSTLAVFIYLQPLIGFILAVIFLDEILDLRFALAAVLVFIGVFLTTRRKKTLIEPHTTNRM